MNALQTKGIDITALLTQGVRAAYKAGDAVMRIYESETFSVNTKADDSPLTRADNASHRIICNELASSHLPLLSEEGRHTSFDERKDWQFYWLVDPLDGTKEFIKRNGEFTVNVALMKGAVPIAGVVYAPCLNVLYGGAKGEGAFKIEAGTKTPLPPAEETTLPQLLQKETVTVVASRSHNNPETEAFIAQFKNAETVTMGSSLKFVLLAEGKADAYPRLAPTMEWDTAAAHAILNAVNKKIYEQDLAAEIVYNKPSLINPSFIAF